MTKEIKKIDTIAITEQFNLDFEHKDFIFKSPEITPKHHFKPQKSDLRIIVLIQKEEANFTVG